MRYLSKTILVLSMLLLLACGRSIEVVQLPSLPGIGLSGLYAGEIAGDLYVAGGCNFPDKPVTEGGKKAFYNDIWKLSGPSTGSGTGWTSAGKLPQASAYAAYLATDDGLLIMGGANASGTLDCVWLFDGCKVKELPALPKPLEQAAWCSYDGAIYLAGGLSGGTPSLEVFKFVDGSWSVAAMLPRPLVQGIACADEGRLNIFGGFDPVQKEAVKGGYSFLLADGSMSELSADVTFVGSAALDGLACGGCNAEVFTGALNLSAEEVREYQLQPVEYYKFRGQLLEYTLSGWNQVAQHPALARAGAALAEYRGGLVSVGGELKPGIRTPEVWMIKKK